MHCSPKKLQSIVFMLKKFKILSDRIPLSMVSTINQIWYIVHFSQISCHFEKEKKYTVRDFVFNDDIYVIK
ncbi:hypothetical protein KUTeg_024899 [Tegillarca granosa]|uniref:Uncharacterized protein n=1 Tax=Tegillarca granosa TaxID=220873 RepID=A0ABQ9DYR9_TEGGR|nr:hypothetical protein KUTeg_024899 [Tegillarca granosa]